MPLQRAPEVRVVSAQVRGMAALRFKVPVRQMSITSARRLYEHIIFWGKIKCPYKTCPRTARRTSDEFLTAAPSVEPPPRPLPRALPAWAYNHPEMTRLEYERILKPSWQIVCHVSSIPKPGDYVTLDLGADSVVALRSAEWGDPALS